MKKTILGLLALGCAALTTQQSIAGTYEDCLLESVMAADSELTAGELRAKCQTQTETIASTVVQAPAARKSAVEERIAAETYSMGRDFAITTHQPNYILGTYNSQFEPEDSIYAQIDPKYQGLKKEEVKFQVSMKMPVWREIFGTNNDLYFGYTQTNWWQLFASSSEVSAPFRETNYEPELFLRHFGGPEVPFGGRVVGFDLGIVHQSNGRSEPISRSWNRVMGRMALDYGDLLISTRVWWRIPEDKEDDDNPNEQRYLGYGDIRATWAPNKNTISAMWRPGTDESGFELTYSYPLTKYLRVYGQWWYGYGESLVDYNQKVNRFGIGIALSDWLMRNN